MSAGLRYRHIMFMTVRFPVRTSLSYKDLAGSVSGMARVTRGMASLLCLGELGNCDGIRGTEPNVCRGEVPAMLGGNALLLWRGELPAESEPL
jgi:hypothetical protein